MFRTFDFANPDTSSQLRFRTTVPQQALFLMNSPFVLEQARCVASRAEIKNANCPQDSVRGLYQVILQRSPTRDELDLGEKFLSAGPNVEASGSNAMPKTTLVERYAQVLLLSNEVMFVD